MADWYLCLTPDWNERGNGLFRQNTAGQINHRFWRNQKDGSAHGLTSPPIARHKSHGSPDRVFFAIEATPAAKPDYTVSKIQVNCAPKGNGARQASPFRDPAGRVDCSFEAAPSRPVMIGDRKYYVIGPYKANRDSSATQLTSRYELLITATLKDTRKPRTTYEYSLDPEMQVDNS